MTRWFYPTSLQLATAPWKHPRFKKSHSYRHVKHYRLLYKVAHGSTGIVYLALDTKTKKLYAVKEMNLMRLQRQQDIDQLQSRHPKHQQQSDSNKRRRVDASVKNTYQESSILQSLRHDHIVKWVDCFEVDNHLYLVTEWVEGGVLVNLYEGRSLLTLSACHSVFIQLVDTLDYLHKQNVIHGDIKPENILLTKDNQAKLIDFGSAIQLMPGNHAPVPQQRRRTPAFTPPECVRKDIITINATECNESAEDVWSLGMTLYCMVYGKLPYDGKKTPIYYALTSMTHLHHDTNSDPHLCDLLNQMLKVSPAERITLEQIKSHPWILARQSSTSAQT